MSTLGMGLICLVVGYLVLIFMIAIEPRIEKEEEEKMLVNQNSIRLEEDEMDKYGIVYTGDNFEEIKAFVTIAAEGRQLLSFERNKVTKTIYISDYYDLMGSYRAEIEVGDKVCLVQHKNEDVPRLVVKRAEQNEVKSEPTADPSQEAKADRGKPQLSLVPRKIIFAIAKVREYGNKKYGDPDNWKTVEKERYRDAAFRHFMAYLDDPKGLDEESGLPHLDHLACNIAFLCELEEINTEANDVEKEN